MLNNSSTKLVMLVCIIGSLISVVVDAPTLVLILFVSGFLYHAIDYYFIRDTPVSLRTMRELILELKSDFMKEPMSDESSNSIRTIMVNVNSHIEEYLNAASTFDNICRVNCMDAGKNITKTNLTKSVDAAKDVMKYGEKALTSNCNVMYSRLKVVKLRRNITEEDKLYLEKYNSKNKEILMYIEKLLNEVGELNKGNYDVINLKEYVDALKELNGE